MEPIVVILIFFGIMAGLLLCAAMSESKKTRMLSGLAAFGWSGLMFMAANMAESFELNVWYSSAADNLLESSIEAIDAGQANHVSTELSAMRDKLEVTYEHRGNFHELALATAKRIRSGTARSDPTEPPAESSPEH